MLVAQKVTTGVYKGVTTSELDELAAETAASMTASHPDYALVGLAVIPTLWCMLQHALCMAKMPSFAWQFAGPPISFDRDHGLHCRAAGGSYCGVQPAQEHTQELQRNVSCTSNCAWSPLSPLGAYVVGGSWPPCHLAPCAEAVRPALWAFPVLSGRRWR